MKQRFILALLIVFAGFASCKDDTEVVQAPIISGLENAYTVLENAELKLTPTIKNDNNSTYIWQLDGKEVAKTLDYVFVQSTPGYYKLVLKVANKGGVDEKTISIIVESKEMRFETTTHSLLLLELPEYMKGNENIEWKIVETASEIYRFSQMTGVETPMFIAAKEGKYLLQVSSGDLKEIVSIVVTKATEEPSPYIANVFDYLPAPGQFVNKMPQYETGDTHADMVVKVAEALVGEDASIITLGGWGGYVTFGFDHTIVNVAGRRDFRIEGNAYANNSEPGIIMVSYDANGNGKPDDEWYEIKGSANFGAENEEWYQSAVDHGNDVNTYRNFEMTYYKPKGETPEEVGQEGTGTDGAYIDDYIRWTNNKGKEGYKVKNKTHTQSYYPLWESENKITFKGIRLAQNGVDESGQGSFFILKSFNCGYADNHSNIDDGSAIDIDWAIDKDGNKVNLPGIDFVKVYTGVDQENGWAGENSTEIGKASNLHMLGESINTINK